MQWVCIIGDADKRKNREDDIVFKHQYLEVKGCLRYFVAASSAPDEDGLLGARRGYSEQSNVFLAQPPWKYWVGTSGRLLLREISAVC